MEGTIGEIRLFAANFAPRDWWYCDGSLLAIRSNTALFAILGTTYGGDGIATFGLPNLAGRSALGAGQGPGLSYYDLGESRGTNAVTLNVSNLPLHTHLATGTIVVPASSQDGDSDTPSNNVVATKDSMYTSQAGNSSTKPTTLTLQVGVSGENIPLQINQPSLGMNYIICLYGVFPPRA
ncbi:MAG: tail fiber protein [Candidatus Chryseobacterium colombiense]|nr:tail fiber protein [Chryseobacterium sp.]WEK70372.1 MAG: tail fiber protein [Chryseobacterium sp.]